VPVGAEFCGLLRIPTGQVRMGLVQIQYQAVALLNEQNLFPIFSVTFAFEWRKGE
jgi:hypothetical protein